MKRIVLLLAGLAMLLGSVQVAAERYPAGLLAKVHLQSEKQVEELLDLDLDVFEVLPTWALVGVDAQKAEVLSANGFQFKILGGALLPGAYYLVFSPNRTGFSGLPAWARIIAQDDGVALVKATLKQAEELPKLGFELKKVGATPIRLPSPARFRPAPLDTGLIREMSERVSENHVRWYIQDLQDFGTRYSYAPQCSLSAEYMKQELGWLGLDTEFHTFTIPNPISIYDVCTLDGREAWRVDEAGRIWHTSDGGANWDLQFTEPSGLPLFGCYFHDSLVGWACGAWGLILHTDDGGTTWNEQTSAGANYFFRMDFVDDLHGWAAGGDSGMVASTTDGGATWTIQAGITDLDLYGVSFADTNRGWVAGGAFEAAPITGRILNTTDGGTTWTVQYEDSAHWFFGVDFVDTATGWVAGVDHQSGSAYVLNTTDGGVSWVPQSAPGSFLIDIDFLDASVGWASGFATVIHTDNGGANWVPRSPGPSEVFLGIDFADPDSGWCVGSGARVLRSTNGGMVWVPQYVPVDTLTLLNVVATLPGVIFPDSVVIVCGHYDCTSEDPYFDAPGADDNASGTSLFMEAASVLSRYRFERTIKFIGFSGEEQGLLGSDAYAQEVGANLDIVGVLNFDMIAYLDDPDWDLNVRYNSFSGWLADVMYQVANQYTVLDAVRVYDTSANSDHASFWRIGASAICGIERADTQWNPYYHTSGDRIETLTLPFCTEVVKLGVSGAATIAVPYVVGTEEAELGRGVRQEARLLQNTPNPVVTSTVIRYAIPDVRPGTRAAGHTKLRVYDVTGRLVRNLVDEAREPGVHSVTWDGRDGDQNKVAAGVYFYRLTIGSSGPNGTEVFSQTRKMAVVR